MPDAPCSRGGLSFWAKIATICFGASIALARAEAAPNVVCGTQEHHADGTAGPLAFLFSGQGAQRVGMGQDLYRELALYRSAFEEVCPPGRAFDGVGAGRGPWESADRGGFGQRRTLGRGGTVELTPLDQTAFAQAGLFALEVALFRTVESWGVRPDFLIGHSIGELAAAYVSSVFSLEDACKLVAARGRLMGELPEGGAMVVCRPPRKRP